MKKRWVIRSEEVREKCLKNLSEVVIDKDKYMEIILRPYNKNRSLEQNDMFHGWCGAIADTTGHTKEEIKEILVETVFGVEEYLNLNGEVRGRVRSTSDLNVNEMSDLIERTIQVGAELGASPPEISYGT
tara:strand:- start:63 stop:452 length:390 start_codon:yes stop_codon:yes gene_type:complete